jgi:hypothetical protein
MIFWPNDQSISGQLADSDKDLYQGVMRWGKQIYSNVGAPDVAIVQSWEKRFVQRNLPDNSGYSFTQLVKDFANTYIPITATCTDTDGGENIYEKGTTCSTLCKTDVCLSSTSLKEYYCNGDAMVSKIINCANGCVDGACAQDSFVCNSNHTDSTGKCHHDCGAFAGCHGISPNTCSSNSLKKCNSTCQEISSCKDRTCNCGENLNNCPEDCKEEKLSADLNCDGSVNLTDSAILMSFWGKDPSGAVSCQNPDINQNGAVNLTDFGIMMSQWTVF